MKFKLLFIFCLILVVVEAFHKHRRCKEDNNSVEAETNSTENSTESQENVRPRQPGHGKPAFVANFFVRKPWHPRPYFGHRISPEMNSTAESIEFSKNLTELEQEKLFLENNLKKLGNAETAPEVSNLIKIVGQTEIVPSPMPGVDTVTIKEFTVIPRNKTIENLKIMPYLNVAVTKIVKKRDNIDDEIQNAADDAAFGADWDLDGAFKNNQTDLDVKKQSIPIQIKDEIGDEVHLLSADDGNTTELMDEKSKFKNENKTDDSEEKTKKIVKTVLDHSKLVNNVVKMEENPQNQRKIDESDDKNMTKFDGIKSKQIFVLKPSGKIYENETNDSQLDKSENKKVDENSDAISNLESSFENSEEIAKKILREKLIENCTDDAEKRKFQDSEVFDSEVIILDKKDQENITDLNNQKINDSVDSGENFKVVHKIGTMPAASNIDVEENQIENLESEQNYKFMDDLRDEMDKYEKEKKEKNYLMIEEMIDPIEDRKQFTILRPSYRDLTPNENPIIKKIQETLKNREKRGIFPELSPEAKQWIKKWRERFQENSEVKDFPAPKPLEIESDADPILKKIADAVEDSAPKMDQNSKMSQGFVININDDEESINLSQNDNDMKQDKLDGTKSMSEVIADRLGLSKEKGPIMIEPEGQILPVDLEYFNSNEAEIPSKIVLETKKKMTIIYDEASEDSNSQESSKEQKMEPNQLLKPSKDASEGNIIIGNSQVMFSSPNQPPKITKLESQNALPISAEAESISNEKSDLVETTKQFSKNFVLTLSMSPLMFSIMAGFCLLVLLIKAYFLYFPRTKKLTIPQQKSDPPISVINIEKPLP